MEKLFDKKRSIGEAAKELGLETHVIRFWESKFPQIKPQIGSGSRRYYFNKEIVVLAKIKSLLYDEGYSIAGLQKLLIKRKKSNLKEQNIEFLSMNESPSNQMPEDHNDFSLDNFIPQAPSIKIDNLDSGSQESVEKIIARIELNLKKLEEIW